MEKLIFRFNNLGVQNSFNSKDILGGKGANLAQMARLGLPVPPGLRYLQKFVIFFTEAIKIFQKKFLPKQKKKLM